MSNQAFPIMPMYLLIGVVAIVGLLFVLGDGMPSGEQDPLDVREPDPEDVTLQPFWEKRQTPINGGEVYDFNSEMICTAMIKNWGTGQDEPNRMINNPDGKVGLELILNESECRVARNNGCTGTDWQAKLASGVTTTGQHGKLGMIIFYPIASEPEAAKLIAKRTIPLPPDEFNPSAVGIEPGFKRPVTLRECLPHMNWYQGEVWLQRYEYLSQPAAECTRQSIVNVYPQAFTLVSMQYRDSNPAKDVVIDPVDGQAKTMEEYFASLNQTEIDKTDIPSNILDDEDINDPESVACNMKLNFADPPGFEFLACSPDAFRIAESTTGINCGIRNLTIKGL